jgi:hypothetical protein
MEGLGRHHDPAMIPKVLQQKHIRSQPLGLVNEKSQHLWAQPEVIFPFPFGPAFP